MILFWVVPSLIISNNKVYYQTMVLPSKLTLETSVDDSGTT